MTQEHPITPSPELIEDWIEIAKPLPQRPPNPGELATLAARWGADQELEACCEWFQEFYKTESWVKHDLKHFRDARRPASPPSLKEEALLALAHLDKGAQPQMDTTEASDAIRRALESLHD
jgi:hypothetical protein